MEAERLTTRRVAAGLAVLAVVGVVAGWGVAMRGRPKPVRIAIATPGPAAAESELRLYVHVAGAVVSPGLYRLAEGARVDDAVAAAGGARGDADLDAVNLAARLRDGDKVVVPVQGAEGADGAAGEASGRINLNSAGAAELEQLPGIGPSLAQRIVDHRTKHGPFRTVDDLKKVSGIGEAKFAQLADLVTV